MTDQPMDNTPFGPDLWDVLARYSVGESPAQEAEAVRRWLAEDPRRAELLASLQRAVGALAFRPTHNVDIEAAWRRVADRIDQPDVRVLPIRRRWGITLLQAAAAVALLVGGVAVWRASQPALPAGVAARTYTTPVGRTDSIRLDDGSQVVLGPASAITVAAGYGQPARAVDLQGEALFDVVHDEQHPFTVRAGAALIEDIGTTFSVRSDGDEPVKVVVTAGSVRLQGQGPQQGGARGPVVLKPGDRGTVDKTGRAAVEFSKATPDDLAWTRGQLIFDDAPLGRVQADLRRWYGVQLTVADPALASRHLTASFAGEPLQRVLDVIGLALGAKIERHGDTAVVRAR